MLLAFAAIPYWAERWLSSAEVQGAMETMMAVVVLGTGLVQLRQQAHDQGEMKLGSVAAAAAGLTQAICSPLLAAVVVAAATLIRKKV